VFFVGFNVALTSVGKIFRMNIQFGLVNTLPQKIKNKS